MVMIPLPFLFTLAALALLWREVEITDPETRNTWLLGFFAMLAFQTALIGLRFSYGIDKLILIQPVSGAALSVLGYLAFARPKNPARHLLVFVGLFAVLALAERWVDIYLAMLNLGYGIALVTLALRGDPALSWAEINRLPNLRRLLWGIAGLLILSGITDAIITLDAWRTEAANTARIAAIASTVFAVLVFLGIAAPRLLRRDARAPDTSTGADHDAVYARITTLMTDQKLFTDPDLNLNRIARRLSLPARDISRAINEKAKENLSQFVNRFRITEACMLLESTDKTVTEVMFRVGFNTKSNFNREFSRLTGQSPSRWRRDKTTIN